MAGPEEETGQLDGNIVVVTWTMKEKKFHVERQGDGHITEDWDFDVNSTTKTRQNIIDDIWRESHETAQITWVF